MTAARIIQLLAEEETKLVDRLFPANAKRMSVAFTAPERRSGCSWLVSRIAQRLAERVPGSACVVDANLHWPSLHMLFGIPNERGLIQAAMQPEEPIRNFTAAVPNSKLWLLPSGGTLSEATGAVSPEAMKARIAELARDFEYILIDTPAMKGGADSAGAGRLANGVVIVVAANASRREAAVNTRLALEAANVPILGAVLNRRTFPIPDRIYQYL
ncbi:MAG TPA: CpsD/CapB family tyrosine-protein kinase [Terriglobia bacterium]|jgi:Mrp family chromosome partitioning ATPase